MDATFFGVQIALFAPPGDPLRGELASAVRAHRGDQSLTEKRAYYANVVGVLERNVARFRFGTWDFVTEGAERLFDEWVAGLERSADENPGDVIDDEHVVATLVFLLETGSDAEETVGERCDLPEESFHTRATYARLAATVRMLTFAGVLADGAYVVPGAGGPGLAAAELTGEGWDYLNAIED